MLSSHLPLTVDFLYHATASSALTPKSPSCLVRYFSLLALSPPLESFSAFCFINLLPVVNDAS